jgi:hypothetical protein
MKGHCSVEAKSKFLTLKFFSKRKSIRMIDWNKAGGETKEGIECVLTINDPALD